jgi:hypothetical protein
MVHSLARLRARALASDLVDGFPPPDLPRGVGCLAVVLPAWALSAFLAGGGAPHGLFFVTVVVGMVENSNFFVGGGIDGRSCHG